MIKRYKEFLFSESGLIALPSIIILSMIILTIGISMSFSSFTQNNISSNNYSSQKSFFVAEAGIKDAIMKITRNKNYNTAFILLIDEDTANVTINTTDPTRPIITSVSTINNYTKKIQATLNITQNGKVTILSWNELSI